jgi:phytoene dehydrogenase-like protein
VSKGRDIVIVGGGHNGLVAAYYLAKAGFKPLVLESRPVVGGAAITDEIHPGFRCPTLAHSAGPLAPHVLTELGLERHGLERITPATWIFAPTPDGRSVSLHEDDVRTAASLAKVSERDARSYPEFQASFGRIGRVLAPLLAAAPPSIDAPTAGDAWAAVKFGKAFRALPKKDAYRLLRWGPMAVADLVAEWFETEVLRAAIAARGIFGMFAGPWSAGSSLGLLLQAAAGGRVPGPAAFVKGGLGSLSAALEAAAKAAGAEVRTNARVERITVSDGRVTGVALADGEEIAAGAVVSNADPKRTFLGLLDPTDLTPTFLQRIQNYRSVGTAAKVNIALSKLPTFSAVSGNGANAREALSGRIHIGPEIDYLERAFDAAKYGEYSAEPYLDVTIPSISDPSLAPQGAHVCSIYVQFAPYKLKSGDWDDRREEFGDAVVKTLATYAPDLPGAVVARQVLTPPDLERTYGLTGGHILHGEPALDQSFAFRPVMGWAQYRTPISGLYLCGAGTHPGGGVTGAPGANAAREIVKDLKKA